MKKIENRIEILENQLFDDFKWGSTRISSNCLTEAEIKLFDSKNALKIFANDRQFFKYFDNANKHMIRRGLDFFLSMLNVQLNEDKGSFLLNLLDFVSKQMYMIHYNHGSDILYESIIGDVEEVDLPDENDPKWKKLSIAEETWIKDFKNFWEEIMPNKKKIWLMIERSKKGVSINEIKDLIVLTLSWPTAPEIAVKASKTLEKISNYPETK
jgi:hypothetical protein